MYSRNGVPVKGESRAEEEKGGRCGDEDDAEVFAPGDGEVYIFPHYGHTVIPKIVASNA